MGLEKLACFYDVLIPTDSVNCLVSSDVLLSSIVYFGFLAVFIGGWTIYRDFAEGLLVGGLGGVALGFGLVLLDWLLIETWMVSVVLFSLAMVIVIIRKSGQD